jgi:hypothetical protein
LFFNYYESIIQSNSEVKFLRKKLSKVGFYRFYRYLYNMKELKKPEEKKVKISITLSPDLEKRMEDELTNKSRLIEKLLRNYYGDKNL